MLYTRLNGGLRKTREALETANKALSGILGKIPSFNTILNWTKKCGLDVYESTGELLKNKDYALITDESMMIGSEKLLVTLGVSAEHQGRPLNSADASVLGMFVAESWNGESVCQKLKESSVKVGKNPLYAISDNASVMKKGVRCAKIPHHLDISHSLGMFLERAYKKASDFTKYLKSMSDIKFKHNMKKIAYLLPPTQRTISRFLNLSGWVKWSSKMLNTYDRLTAEEQEVFSFIPENKLLINELMDVVTCVQSVEKICKNEGLSKRTIDMCHREIKQYLLHGNPRMIQLGQSISDFFTEQSKLLSDTAVHNNSSDILESIFGKYKARKSPNKLNGVTSFILFIPIYAKLSDYESAKKFDFKVALENKRMRKIGAWAKKNLTPNLNTLRTKSLGKQDQIGA